MTKTTENSGTQWASVVIRYSGRSLFLVCRPGFPAAAGKTHRHAPPLTPQGADLRCRQRAAVLTACLLVAQSPALGAGKLLLTTVFKESEQPSSEPVRPLLATVSLQAGLAGIKPYHTSLCG